MKLITTYEPLFQIIYKESFDDARKMNWQHSDSLYIMK